MLHVELWGVFDGDDLVVAYPNEHTARAYADLNPGDPRPLRVSNMAWWIVMVAAEMKRRNDEKNGNG